MDLIVDEHHIITLTYELREDNAEGELMERMDANYPFIFLFGTDKLLPAFEAQLEGLKEGDTFDFILPPNHAYGAHRADNIVKVPKAAFDANEQFPQQLEENSYVTLTDDLGYAHNGKILKISDQEVSVDLNHHMVDKYLHFKGAILNIRKATVDELIQKRYIQPGGVHRSDFGDEEMY